MLDLSLPHLAYAIKFVKLQIIPIFRIIIQRFKEMSRHLTLNKKRDTLERMSP